MHLPLSAGEVAMLWSRQIEVIAFLSHVRVQEGGLTLEMVAVIFIMSCSASVLVQLLFLMVDSVVVISPTMGTFCGEMSKVHD